MLLIRRKKGPLFNNLRGTTLIWSLRLEETSIWVVKRGRKRLKTRGTCSGSGGTLLQRCSTGRPWCSSIYTNQHSTQPVTNLHASPHSNMRSAGDEMMIWTMNAWVNTQWQFISAWISFRLQKPRLLNARQVWRLSHQVRTAVALHPHTRSSGLFEPLIKLVFMFLNCGEETWERTQDQWDHSAAQVLIDKEYLSYSS